METDDGVRKKGADHCYTPPKHRREEASHTVTEPVKPQRQEADSRVPRAGGQVTREHPGGTTNRSRISSGHEVDTPESKRADAALLCEYL